MRTASRPAPFTPTSGTSASSMDINTLSRRTGPTWRSTITRRCSRRPTCRSPRVGWTWADFLRDARALTIVQSGHPVQWGVQLPGTWLRAGLQEFVATWGGQILSPDGSKVTGYLTSPASKQAIAYYLNLYNKY